ncbi:unnamed protein product [Tilletia controversa]|nr:hypothetical protein CF335_g7735 [Tilletia laevis]KAE8194165.1 hypothetical protein CF336_g3651 [Tilletia laevis]CAD6974635.1 unnamed protein product [Tilletia controversa]
MMGPPSDVSDTTLAALGDSGAQEAHVRPCLENGGGGSLQSGRYLVYKLPDGSPSVAKDWSKNGRACPVHAQTS